MEVYLSLTMFSLINLMNMDWDTDLPSVNFSNFFAIVGTIVAVVCPIILIVFTMRHYKDLNKDEFQKRHGVMLEGLEVNYMDRTDVQFSEINKLQRIVVIVSGFHFMRRFLLCISLVCWREPVSIQIVLQMAFSMAYIGTVAWYRPFETALANRLEIFTECVTLGALYTLMLFTDFVPEAQTRYMCGVYFIGLLMVYLAVHLIVILRESSFNVLVRLRRCKARRR